MKNLIIITAIVLFSVTKLSAQKVGVSGADAAWKAMPAKPFGNFEEKDEVKKDAERERLARKYLDAGIGVAKQFPKDKRTVEWYTLMTNWIAAPRFWQNPEEAAKAKASEQFYTANLDWRAFRKTEKEMQLIRKGIMENPAIAEDEKQKIRQNELQLEMNRNENTAYRGTNAQFLARVKKAMETAFSNLKPGDRYTDVYRQVERLFFQRNLYGLQTEELEKFAGYFKGSSHREIQQWAMQKLSVFALEREPFELKHQAVDGQEIDLAKLRGKVVLVDFWSNTCTVCIERMPAIKAVYDKYKDKGFVVISAANNPNMDKELIMKIHHRIGADWPVLMIGGDSDKSGYVAEGSIADKIWKKYGFNFVPQLLLLDKEGKLAMYNGVLMNGDFEPMVKELLAK